MLSILVRVIVLVVSLMVYSASGTHMAHKGKGENAMETARLIINCLIIWRHACCHCLVNEQDSLDHESGIL